MFLLLILTRGISECDEFSAVCMWLYWTLGIDVLILTRYSDLVICQWEMAVVVFYSEPEDLVMVPRWLTSAQLIQGERHLIIDALALFWFLLFRRCFVSNVQLSNVSFILLCITRALSDAAAVASWVFHSTSSGNHVYSVRQRWICLDVLSQGMSNLHWYYQRKSLLASTRAD